MTILRGPTEADHFTILPNRVIRDQRLSFRARGVLAYLLSMPPGWRTSSTRVARETREGRDAIRTALEELRALGYATLDRHQNDAGQWVTEWTITDRCGQPVDNEGYPKPENPASVSQAVIEVLSMKDLYKGVRDMTTDTCGQL